MLFYRVNKRAENERFIHVKRNGHIELVDLYPSELLTENELSHYRISDNKKILMFDKVEISKKKTHWFFGARFED